MELELKHVAPYVIYKPEFILEDEFGRTSVFTMNGFCSKGSGEYMAKSFIIDEVGNELYLNYVKLLLRPLSYLTKEIEVNGEKFVPMREIYIFIGGGYSSYKAFMSNCYPDFMTPLIGLSYNIIQKLYEWHFDISGLIEKGLAIDINTLK